ncbi:GerAB/ArcD/ProY family transporter [Alkalihalobacillus sp. LMS39]|uniref:GerAB/ArcD/ProY family transporter n=1 Tax=Alkalihalobacillus sp. LMS39 TaxID=2924032 RepID=UPI001FB3ED7C|nr:GerAB/ArcD/ProY family transporter [Alkalihalobacillus sp. LMS39]UOE94834.1 GerAB/ArcD/ProY family transporter [Alkalihalobacillus sp. LMS39]
MIQPTDGKLGTRELFAMLALMVGIKLSDGTPMILIEAGMNATWMIPILSGLIVFIPLLCLLSLLKKYKDKHLVDLTFTIMGKYIGFLFCFLMLVAIVFSNALNERTTVNIISTMFFPKTPIIAIFLFLIGGSYAIAKLGLEATGRTSWLILPYIKVILFLLFLFIFLDIRVEHLFPIAGPGLDVIVKESLTYQTIYFEFILLALFFTSTRTEKNFRMASLFGLAFVVMEMAVTYAYFVMMFDYPSVREIAYPFQQLTRMLEVGTIITSYEGLFLGFWIIACVLRFALYLLFSVKIVAYMFNIQDYKPLLLPLATLTLLIGLLPENPTDTTYFLRDIILLQFIWQFIMVMPIILWVVSKAKGYFHAKNRSNLTIK